MYKLCVNKDPFTGEVFEPNMVCKTADCGFRLIMKTKTTKSI